MEYCAIIGDIKQSRECKNRYEVQERLKKVLYKLNLIYRDKLAAEFLITLGDEFQGILENVNHVLKIVKYIQKEMYPIKLRFGIGIGMISTKINKKAAIGADGPAFYAARDAIKDLHEQEKKIKKQASDIQIFWYNKECFELKEINMMLLLLNMIEESWTEKQRYTIWDMMAHHGSQEMCAKRIGTTQSTVARRLADGKYIIYGRLIETIEEALYKLGDIR